MSAAASGWGERGRLEGPCASLPLPSGVQGGCRPSEPTSPPGGALERYRVGAESPPPPCPAPHAVSRRRPCGLCPLPAALPLPLRPGGGGESPGCGGRAVWRRAGRRNARRGQGGAPTPARGAGSSPALDRGAGGGPAAGPLRERLLTHPPTPPPFSFFLLPTGEIVLGEQISEISGALFYFFFSFFSVGTGNGSLLTRAVWRCL